MTFRVCAPSFMLNSPLNWGLYTLVPKACWFCLPAAYQRNQPTDSSNHREDHDNNQEPHEIPDKFKQLPQYGILDVVQHGY